MTTPGGSFCGQLRLADPAGWPVAGWTARGPLGLMLHGEVHNAAALRRELNLPLDTPLPDVLLSGWQHWSERLLTRLDGVFALAIRESERLLLYRDASGMGRLYLHSGRAGMISFATDLSKLMRLPGVPCRIARASLHEYLRFGDIASPRTLYEDVISTEPGQLVCVSTSGIEERSVATPDNGVTPPEAFAEALDGLDALLSRSVSDRLAGAQRPAAFLSGGIDSSLLCAIGARERPDLSAVTVGFDGEAFDESPVAARIAAHLGLHHRVLRFNRAELLQGIERLAAGADQPLADPAAAVTLLAFEHCRHHFDAVLDGTGADESVGLMPPRHVRIAVEYAGRLNPSLRHGLTRLLKTVPALAGYAPLTDFEHPADTMIRWKGFARNEVAALCEEPVSFDQTRFYRTFDRYPRHAHFERYGALLDAMPSDRLSEAAAISGLTVRYPFCERATDRFIRQLRTEHRYLPEQPKRILRALLARYVPAALWDAPKHGFDVPLIELLSTDDHALVRKHVNEGIWRDRKVLAPGLVQQYASRFIAGETRLAFRIWMLVLLGAWLDHRGDLS